MDRDQVLPDMARSCACCPPVIRIGEDKFVVRNNTLSYYSTHKGQDPESSEAVRARASGENRSAPRKSGHENAICHKPGATAFADDSGSGRILPRR
jgi:hypothetical protein